MSRITIGYWIRKFTRIFIWQLNQHRGFQPLIINGDYWANHWLRTMGIWFFGPGDCNRTHWLPPRWLNGSRPSWGPSSGLWAQHLGEISDGCDNNTGDLPRSGVSGFHLACGSRTPICSFVAQIRKGGKHQPQNHQRLLISWRFNFMSMPEIWYRAV